MWALSWGVASGKSLVTQMFQELGAQVISADGIAHEVLCLPEVIDMIVEKFGPKILCESPVNPATRAIDRKSWGRLSSEIRMKTRRIATLSNR